jgi:pyruvate-formate lyase
MVAPDPLMSALVDDCIPKGRDITQNGSRHYFHQILVTGFANTVDALEVIREQVYEKRIISIKDLTAALSANWQGNEPLRMRAVNSVPKFGNSNEKVDKLGVRMLKDFEDYVEEWNRKDLPVKFPCGIGTFENYAALGRDINASADGRFDGEALAPNYSPQPGVDIKGPTAAIKSATLPNLSKYFSGAPFDLSINSDDFAGEVGTARLASLIRSFCELGGQILTITSVNVKDLRDAKVHPENHKNIRVRLGGLSAYFVAMSPVQQDNIIKRFDK